ncbi:MAG: hypothetical protein RLZZ511_2070 [Cyanobacteriota bacterium]|jgi:hypothetical protein
MTGASLALPLPPDDRDWIAIVAGQPLQLQGRYNPAAIARLELTTDRGEPLPLHLRAGRWLLDWPQAWGTPGAHWLRMTGWPTHGGDRDAACVTHFYFHVGQTPADLAPLQLRLLRDSWFRATAQDSTQLGVRQKCRLPAGQILALWRYGRSGSQLQVVLDQGIDPVGDIGYLDAANVELLQGDRVIAPPSLRPIELTLPLDAPALLHVTRTTWLKQACQDSGDLDITQKQQLVQGQCFPLIAHAAIADHWQVRLAESRDRGYVPMRDVQLLQADRALRPAPLNVEILATTPLKTQPRDPARLSLAAKVSLEAGTVWPIRHYAVQGDHLLVTLQDPSTLAGGYVDRAAVQLRRDAAILYPIAGQTELAIVPPTDIPIRQRWPLGNLCTIAVILSALGRSATVSELLDWCLTHHGPASQRDRRCLTALLQNHGCRVTWRNDWTVDQLQAILTQGHPILLPTTLTPAQPYVALIGCRGDDWLVYDPWGDGRVGYQDMQGDRVIYSQTDVRAIGDDAGAIVGAAVARQD